MMYALRCSFAARHGGSRVMPRFSDSYGREEQLGLPANASGWANHSSGVPLGGSQMLARDELARQQRCRGHHSDPHDPKRFGYPFKADSVDCQHCSEYDQCASAGKADSKLINGSSSSS